MRSFEMTSSGAKAQYRPAVPRRGSLIVPGLFFLFVLFPFTQLVPLATYNQPYAILMAAIVLLGIPNMFMLLPQVDRIMLSYLAILGGVLFLAAATQGLRFREISFLISYLTPLLTTVVCYWVMSRYREMAMRMMIISICVWVSVGLIQSLGFPNFLTAFASHSDDLGSNILASGRGTISLAPEPTHFGFHILLLGTSLYLLRGPLWGVALALGAMLVLAKSSSALLALALGIIVWGCVRPLLRIWIFAGIAALLLFSAVIPLLFDDSYRITKIILAAYYSGFDIFLVDYSINSRLSGMFAPFYLFQSQAMMPLGMKLESWAVVREHMLAQFSWIINLSGSGPASGVGLVLLQGGILGVPVVLYILNRFILTLGRKPEGALTAACFWIFMAQFYMAAPTFGLVLASIILRNQERLVVPETVSSEHK